MSAYFLVNNLTLFNSIEKTLKNIEARHAVQLRWVPGSAEFNEVALQVEEKRREDVLSTLHSLSTERYFLLTLKQKYAGS